MKNERQKKLISPVEQIFFYIIIIGQFAEPEWAILEFFIIVYGVLINKVFARLNAK